MPEYVITPWKWRSELLEVRAQAYQLRSNNPLDSKDQRARAVGQIAAWGIRANVPHPVVSTGLLLDAILAHEALAHPTASSPETARVTASTTTVRLAYAAAFSRFVTGFCDTSQGSGARAPMYAVARALGIPASFVELRHEATHERVPALDKLAKGAREGLRWLWERYWALLDANVDQMVVESGVDEGALRAVLSEFLAGRKREIKGGVEGEGKDGSSGVACVKLMELCMGTRAALGVLCKVLLTEKMLIPSNRELGDSMQGAFTIWGNLLRRLVAHQKRFASVLLQQMTSQVTNARGMHVELDTFCEATAAWIQHVFEHQKWRHYEIKARIEERRGQVVQECSMASNVWAQRVTKAVVLSSEEGFQEQWSWLLTPELMSQVDI